MGFGKPLKTSPRNGPAVDRGRRVDLANVIGDDGPDGRRARSEVRSAGELAAPDLVDVETVAVLRKRWMARTSLCREALAVATNTYPARARTNIEIDDTYVRTIMDRYGVHTKTEAVDLALRHLAGQPMTREEALAMRGVNAIGEAPHDDGPASA